MSEISLDQLAGAKPVKAQDEPKAVSFEDALGLNKDKGPSDLETAKATVMAAFKDFPNDWKENSWTWPILKLAGDSAARGQRKLILQDLAAQGGNEEAAKELAELEKSEGMERFIQGKKDIRDVVQDRKKKPLGERVKEGLGEVVESVKDRPVTTAAVVAKSLIYDAPLFAMGGALEIPANVAKVTEAVAKSKGAAAVAKAAAAGAEGFGLGYGGSAAEQEVKKGKVDQAEAISSGATIAALDVGARTLRGLVPKRDKGAVSPPGAKKVEPTPLEPEFTPEEHRQARKVIEDEHEWGLYNAAVRDHEALKGSWDDVHSAVEEGQRATEQTGEWFRKDIDEPKEPVASSEAESILAKPGFQRTPEERIKLKRWQVQASVAASVGAAYALADDQTKKEIAQAGVLGAAVVPGFYARTPRLVEGLKRKSGTAAEWKAELEALAKKGGGVSEELEHTSALHMLEAWPDKKVKIPKEQVQAILRDNAVELHETELGGELDHRRLSELTTTYRERLLRKYGERWMNKATKEELQNYSKLSNASPSKPTVYGESNVVTPGGTRQRELLLQIPGSRIGEHVHWQGHEDVVAHIRMNERLDAEGRRVLHVEEIQSDAAQAARKWDKTIEQLEEEKIRKQKAIDRWRAGGEPGAEFTGAGKRIAEINSLIPEYRIRRDEDARRARETPFLKDTEAWTSLTLRRILRYAADNGYSRISFITADQMAKRVGEDRAFPQKFYGETVPRILNKIMKTLGGEGVNEKSMKPESLGRVAELKHELQDHGYKTETDSSGMVKIRQSRAGGEEVPIWKLPEDLRRTASSLINTLRMEKEGYRQPGVEITPEVAAKVQKGFAMFDRQGGKAHTELMALVAGAGLGALIAGNINKDSSIMAAAVGAALGALGGRVAERIVAANAFSKSIPELVKGEKAKRVRIEDIIDDHEAFILRSQRDVMQLQNLLFELVPQAKRREVLAGALDGGKEILSADEQRALQAVQSHLNGLSRAAQDVEILEDVRAQFIKNMFERVGEDPRKVVQLTKDVNSGKAEFTFLKGGQDRGMSPRTTDIASIVGAYMNATARSVAHKRVMDILAREGRVPDGNGAMTPLMFSAADPKAPGGYKPVDRPMLRGKVVHPDIVPELRMLFDTKDPDGFVKAISAISTASKRSKVSFSLFHAMALAQADIGASGSLKLAAGGATVGAGIAAATGSDIATGAEFGGALAMGAPVFYRAVNLARGSDKLLEQIRKGGAGDMVDQAMKSGLRFSFERSSPVVTDVAQDFYQGLQTLQNVLDKYVHPIAGKPVAAVEKVNHAIDNMMWGRMHAGMKLQVWAKTKAKLVADNLAARDKAPDTPILTEERAGKIAASYANSLFGGLNWVKLMEGVKSRWGRSIASELMGPTGRRYMGIAMFAPDWTISTTLSAVRALDIRPSQKELGDLHRMYMLRAALWTVGLGEALNYTMSGHHLWENKDPTVVDLGDGWTMQLSKHFYEPFHWITKPGQQALNKLGSVPAEAAEQIRGEEYLSTKGAPKMKGAKERVEHALKQFLPFSTPGIDRDSLARGVFGAAGIPVYPPRKRKKKSEDFLSDAEKTE